MSKQLAYLTIDGLMDKLSRNIPSTFKLEEDDVIEWSGEALQGIGAYNELVDRVYFLPVKNFKCVIPAHSKYIIQISRNNLTQSSSYRQNLCAINEVLQEEAVDDVDIPVLLDCKGTPVTDYDVAYYRPYFSLDWDYGKWISSNAFRRHWTPIRPSQHSFFDVCSIDDLLYVNSVDEYKLEAPFIKFSFQEGMVAVAVASVKLDDTGYPMIPDNYSYYTAISKYILLRLTEKDFYANREGSAPRYQKAEADWQFYCQQASNESMMPSTIDEQETLRTSRMYLLPRTNQVNNFFGNLGTEEYHSYFKNTLKSRYSNGYHQDVQGYNS